MRFLVIFSFSVLGSLQAAKANQIKACETELGGPQGSSRVIKIAPYIFLATYHGIAKPDGSIDNAWFGLDQMPDNSSGAIFTKVFSPGKGYKPNLVPDHLDFAFLVTTKKTSHMREAKISFNADLSTNTAVHFYTNGEVRECSLEEELNSVFETSCKSADGSSGAPYIYENKVIGIHIGASKSSKLGSFNKLSNLEERYYDMAVDFVEKSELNH